MFIEFCLAKKSNKIYKYKRNKNVVTLINILKQNQYIIDSQIINYNNQVIGLLVSQPSKKFKFYVPCLPSNIILNSEYDYKFVQTIKSYNTYEKTFTFLKDLSKKNIPCKPIKKIVEDNFVVGFYNGN